MNVEDEFMGVELDMGGDITESKVPLRPAVVLLSNWKVESLNGSAAKL